MNIKNALGIRDKNEINFLTKKEIENLHISDLYRVGIKTTKACQKKFGTTRLIDLFKKSDKELLTIPGIGKVSLGLIRYIEKRYKRKTRIKKKISEQEKRLKETLKKKPPLPKTIKTTKSISKKSTKSKLPIEIKEILDNMNLEYRIEDAGDNSIFIIFKDRKIENSSVSSKIVNICEKYYYDVRWCPDPESHEFPSEIVYAVLNCFDLKKIEGRKKHQIITKKITKSSSISNKIDIKEIKEKRLKAIVKDIKTNNKDMTATFYYELPTYKNKILVQKLDKYQLMHQIKYFKKIKFDYSKYENLIGQIVELEYYTHFTLGSPKFLIIKILKEPISTSTSTSIKTISKKQQEKQKEEYERIYKEESEDLRKNYKEIKGKIIKVSSNYEKSYRETKNPYLRIRIGIITPTKYKNKYILVGYFKNDLSFFRVDIGEIREKILGEIPPKKLFKNIYLFKQVGYNIRIPTSTTRYFPLTQSKTTEKRASKWIPYKLIERTRKTPQEIQEKVEIEKEETKEIEKIKEIETNPKDQEMAKKIRIDLQGSLYLYTPYDKKFIDIIKSLPKYKRKWNPAFMDEPGNWEIDPFYIESLVKKLEDNGYPLTAKKIKEKTLKNIYDFFDDRVFKSLIEEEIYFKFSRHPEYKKALDPIKRQTIPNKELEKMAKDLVKKILYKQISNNIKKEIIEKISKEKQKDPNYKFRKIELEDIIEKKINFYKRFPSSIIWIKNMQTYLRMPEIFELLDKIKQELLKDKYLLDLIK